MSVKLTLSLLLTVLAVAHCGNILDLINWEDGKKILDEIQRQESPQLRNDINCKWKCKGPACACCIDTNITSYDPVEAKCIHMRYMSKDEGLFVQISLGKKVDYDKIHMTNPGPLCLVSSVMFQMCAVFNHMGTTSDGLRGCVRLEPGTIFASQSKIPLGCFKANDAGMEMMDPPQDLVETAEDNSEDSDDDEEGVEGSEGSEDNVDQFDPFKVFISSVYETAQKSVALLSTLLDAPNNATKPATSTEANSLADSQETPAENTQKRSPKSLKHPNLL